MKKSRNKFIFLFSLIFFVSLFFAVSFSVALAAGSATVSWTPPTTDEGGGPLTGLAGYKVYYDTTSRWASNTANSCPSAGTVVDVPGGSTTSKFFSNNLTPGTTYYFAVAAYDTANPPNISKCARTSSGATEVSKLITYSGDLNNDRAVNLFDFNILHQYYNTSNSIADIDKNGTVNMLDFNILHLDYGKSF